MVDEVRQTSTLIDVITCRHHALGKRTRPATEDTNFADLQTKQSRYFYKQQQIITVKAMSFSSIKKCNGNSLKSEELRH